MFKFFQKKIEMNYEFEYLKKLEFMLLKLENFKFEIKWLEGMVINELFQK
jgi:hypothetical protein